MDTEYRVKIYAHTPTVPQQPGYIITYGNTLATTMDVYVVAHDVTVMESGVLYFVDENYNTIRGFAAGQWLDFEKVELDESQPE